MNKILQWLMGNDEQMAKGGELSLRFVSDYSPYVNLLILVVLAGLVWLTIRSYRREGDNPRGVKILLAALRVAVVAMLVLTFFRPAITQRTVRTLHSSVIVLVDDSLSMSFKDKYATDPKKVKALADYLGVPESQIQLMTRQEIVRKALQREGGAAAKLAQEHPLRVMKFSTTQPGKESYVKPLETIEAMRDDKKPTTAPANLAVSEMGKAFTQLNASGYATNLSEAIRSALENAQGQRIAGLVVISDGTPTNDDPQRGLGGAASYARERGVPVYTIVVGDPTLPKNLAVVSLQAPREIRKDSPAEFAAVVAHRNMDKQSVTVKLEMSEGNKEKWTDTGVSAAVTLESIGHSTSSGTRGSQSVPLKIPASKVDRIGNFYYRAVVAAASDEQDSEDNLAEAVCRVVDNKINVLLIAGDSGWEFQYLRNFIQRQPDLYKLSVWQQNTDPEVSQLSSTEEMKLEKMPSGLVQLIGAKGDKKKPGYHVIVLYDPRPEKKGFDAKFLADVKRFVSEHGGGLCYIAGNKYTDDTCVNSGAFKDLQSLLPVELAAHTGIDVLTSISEKQPEPWQATPTSYALDHQITRLGNNATETANIWGNLPGIFWSHPVHKIKPLTRVLLDNSNPGRQTGRSREPLLAVHMYGKGPVVYVGTDDTWRWRALDDAAYHRKFWNNILGYLATLKASRVVITTGGDRFDAGEEIKIDVEAYDDKFAPLSDESFEIQAVNVKDKSAEKIKLTQEKDKNDKPTGRFRGVFTPARMGTYDLTAPSVKDGVESKRIIVDLPQAERHRTEASEDTMAFLASKPQNFLRIHELDKLAGTADTAPLIPVARLTSVQEHSKELWNTKLMLIVLVVLLAVEWILRKKYNMA